MSRLAAPKAWMLDKLGGAYAPKPSPGPHKQRECLPLSIFIRNRLKYALTGREVTLVVKQRLIKIDNKLLKVRKVQLGAKGVPFIVTHDGRTIRYPDPAIKVNDVVKFDLVENIVDHVK